MSKIKLYDVFGELLYVLAMADGQVQEAEVKKLEELLADHPWGREIKWSFDYEVKQGTSPEDLYRKVILYCEAHGPDPEYKSMLEIMQAMAEASAGVDVDEQTIVDSFVIALTERFKEDIERINAAQR